MEKSIFKSAQRSLTLLAVVFISAFVLAGEVEYKNVRYLLDENRMTAEVASNPKASGAVVIPEEITVSSKKYRVVSISEKAFKGAKNLKSVKLPASIEYIGRFAFEGSGILKNKASWKKGAIIINGCLIATNAEMPAKFVYKGKEPLRLIAERAFSGSAKTLKSVTLPDIPPIASISLTICPLATPPIAGLHDMRHIASISCVINIVSAPNLAAACAASAPACPPPTTITRGLPSLFTKILSLTV